MPKNTLDYEEGLLERLKDAEFASEYLNAALEDQDEESPQRFLVALRQLARSQGMTTTSELSGMSRQAMYRALSVDGNPEFSSLHSILAALGFKLSVEPKKKLSA